MIERVIHDRLNQFKKLKSRMLALTEVVRTRYMIESVLATAILLTLIVYLFEGTRFIHSLHELLAHYWQWFFGLILLVLVIRIWIVAGHPSVVVMPFDVTSPSPVRSLTGIALSRMVFDEIRVSLGEKEKSTGDLGQKNLYQPELPKAAQPTADLGPAVTLDYKGLSIDSVLNFTRRLRGTVAVVTGELIVDDLGIVIRCRCSLPSFFGSTSSRPYRESEPSTPESWRVREAVQVVARMLAADLKREACNELPLKQAASMLVELGKEYSGALIGDRAGNLQEAIRCFDEALAIFGKASHPKERARTMNYRGNAYRSLPGPDRIANLLSAIDCYEQARDIYKKEAVDPRAWAGTTGNLGATLQQMPDRYGHPSLREAISYYDQAIRALEDLPAKNKGDSFAWARTKRNKANVLVMLRGPDRIQNLGEALKIYDEVLEVFQNNNPEEWAYTMNAIANAYRQLRGPDRTENLRKALDCFELALQVYTRTRYPTDWAQIMLQKGNACRDLLGPDRSANLRDAVSCYDQALEIYVKERYPVQWASALNNRGIAYRDLPGPDRLGNLAEALKCFDAALTVYSRYGYPLEWANAQNLRGTAYQQLPGPDRSANLLAAIGCYEAALEVRVRKDFPADWAQTTRNKAAAYGQLPGPDRGANLREAIRGFEAVLEIFTQFSYPEEWANTTRMMGAAYAEMRMPYAASGNAAGVEGAGPDELSTTTSAPAEKAAATPGLGVPS
jgi:tetratricopeptide (TPR) repeat protein